MKILTLNTHSLAEENALRKMEIFAEKVEKEQPEIMAFQPQLPSDLPAS